MFKTAWRAGPGPRSVMRFCFARHLVFRARYPLGIRAVVNGATGHDQATVIAGVVVVVVALSVPASWALPIIRASLNSRRTDQGNLALFSGWASSPQPLHITWALARGLVRESPPGRRARPLVLCKLASLTKRSSPRRDTPALEVLGI